ncbi:NAD(P)/FAD-dependent oxidoreductase [Capnocytophaga gingivalis]|jgi:flavoprotein family protein|uniref:NAD(P)/FAD-dependent oxidoreductase n=1 Tax=Capnocytophaga gingivalis TaxID=1017 RepID=UPI0028D65890|nr:NAD(P)/FAD-dependent oxidoreductase [Capnocytophaga gingivalis]
MTQLYDVIILGAGACGLFTAINIAEGAPHKRILILEKGKEALGKVRISGGGRCNLTNGETNLREFVKNYPRGNRELLSAFSRFSNKDTMKWFETHQVALKEEDDGRVFPLSNSSQTIIDCFLSLAKKYNIEILYKQNVHAFSFEKEEWKVQATEVFHSRNLVVATGSNPKVWQLLSQLGHTIVPPVPSLFTFATEDSFIEGLAGVSKEVNAKLLATDHSPLKIPLLEKQGLVGALLVTHWGFSGPVVLRLSAFAARDLAQLDYKFALQINWLAEEEILSSEEALSILQEEKQKHPRKELQNHCPFNLTKKLWNKLLERSGALPHLLWAELNKAQLHALAHTLTHSIFPIEGKATFKEEFVTAGGVSLKEIDFKSFRSKLFPTLYIGGEALDIDAVTGGYNFQNAWSSGYLIAEGVKSE